MAANPAPTKLTDEDVRFIIQFWIKFPVIEFSQENWYLLQKEFNKWVCEDTYFGQLFILLVSW